MQITQHAIVHLQAGYRRTRTPHPCKRHICAHSEITPWCSHAGALGLGSYLTFVMPSRRLPLVGIIRGRSDPPTVTPDVCAEQGPL